MQLNISFTLLLFISILQLNYGQTTQTVSGQVVEAVSNEPIVGANVYSGDFKYGTITDEYGRFALKMEEAPDFLVASYIGYTPDTCVGYSGQCMFELSVVELAEVVVKPKSDEIQQDLGHFVPSVEQIKKLPALFGDVDIVKSLTLLPGISGGIEGSSMMSVRGGNLSHNLILLDGTPVYNANHLFGFMSSFNPEATKHVDLYKGGFPAQYGGRLASVLNVVMKEGSMRKRSTELSVGLVNNSIMTEGPIVKDKISYMLASRMFNLGIISALLSKVFDEFPLYWVNDINAKLKFKLSDKQTIFASYFRGKDNVHIKGIDDTTIYNWGNQVASLRYYNQLTNSFFLDAGVFYNQYKYQLKGISMVDENSSFETTSNSRISDVSAKVKARWDVFQKYRIVLGGEVSQKEFVPVDFERGQYENGIAQSLITGKSRQKSLDYVGFLGNEVGISENLDFYAGARFINYQSDAYSFSNIELRSSIKYTFRNNNSLKLSFDQMYQPFHLLSTVGNTSPNEIWVPGNNDIPPSKSNQWSIGYSQKIASIKSKASIEVFTKKMTNLVRYKPGAAYVFLEDDNWRDQVIGKGDGKVWGVELFVSSDFGKLSGWMGYTYLDSQRKYAQTNYGRWFAANYDRRHELEFTASYQLSDEWSLASSFVFQSGRPLTLPKAFYQVPDDQGVWFSPNYQVIYEEINSNRTKNYHRLDLSITKKYKTRRDREASWTFGAYNLYMNNNPLFYTIKFNENIENGTSNIILEQKSFLNFIPSVNYRIKF